MGKRTYNNNNNNNVLLDVRTYRFLSEGEQLPIYTAWLVGLCVRPGPGLVHGIVVVVVVAVDR